MGTVVSMMLPYTGIVLVTWTIFFVIWYLLGIPWGPAPAHPPLTDNGVNAAGPDRVSGPRRAADAIVAAKVWLLRTAYRSRFGTLLRRMTAVGGLSRA